MKWVLIIYLAGYVNNGGSGGPATAEFLTQDNCEKAAEAVKEKASRYYIFHVCAPNGR